MGRKLLLICVTVILLAVTGLSIHAAAVGTNDEQWVATWVATLHQPSPGPVPAALAPAKPGDYFDARFDPEEDAIVFRRLRGRESRLGHEGVPNQSGRCAATSAVTG